MRILAIRGTNLASLPEFSIDFSAEPLNRSGLFAITGKTGAGKSTILDALCIALFDKTPRLAGGGAMVGRPDGKDDYRVNAGDVRSIVRQGTSGGSAEVDFVGRDGRQYRASWQARRARNRADGKFQAQTVGLLDIETNQPLGGTKTETLALIQEKIGLTYEQFRRSVLLAQGEFAAFLRADGKERAELLEKITGTDIYARLSIAAFSRKRQEELVLDKLIEQLGSIKLLSDEELASAKAELEEQEAALRQSRERLAELVRYESWYGRHDQLQESLVLAEKSLLTFKEALEVLQPLRERLVKVEGAERFRPLIAAVDRAGETVAASEARRDKLLADVAAAQSVMETKRTAAIETEKAVEIATKQLDDAQPLIVKARELDTRLTDGNGHLKSLTEAFSAALNESEEAKRSFKAIEEQLAVITREIQDADTWLVEHKWAAPVVTEWERWRTELERYSASHGRIRELNRLIADGTKASKDAEGGAQATREALATSEALFTQASTAADAAEKAALGVDLAETRRRIDEEQARLTAAGVLHRVAGDAMTALTDMDAADSRMKVLAEAIRACDLSLAEDRTNLPSSIAARDEAERSLTLARATLDFAEHRANLKDGDSCPLCGSLEHPYRTGSEPAGTLVSSLEIRFNELRDAVSAIDKRYAGTAVKRESLEKDIQREQHGCETLMATIEKLHSEWLEQSTQFPTGTLPANPADKAATSETSRIREAASSALAALRTDELSIDALLKAVAPARAAMDKARNERDTNLDRLKKAEDLTRETARVVLSLAEEQSKEEKALAAILSLLETPFKDWVGWRSKAEDDSAAFISEVGETKNLWNDWSERRNVSVAARDSASTQAKESAARRELLEKAADEKKTAAHEQERFVGELVKERAKLFEGRPVDEIEQSLSKALSSARELARIAADEAGAKEMEVTSLVATLDEVKLQHTAALSEQSLAKENLVCELSGAEIQEVEARELLSATSDWRKESHEKLDKAAEELRDAGTRLTERKEALGQHLKTDVPAIARDVLAARKDVEDAWGRELEDKAFSIRHSLTVDDENRKNTEDLLPKIDAQRSITTLWLGMSDLIGSADGKKFRVFAQSLTLDLLLAMANEHLSSLSPRFSMMRVPSSEMELQVVDRDMGDDIRGVNSISGGESFLVSLGLALGLSTLASGTTRIGSLFIDEGFGSLDQDTLDTALSTLDALQSSGRMVGVISHVSGLTERIGTRIEVTATGGGKSSVTVIGV